MAPSPSDTLSIIAIVLAVVAFLISVAQLLQQYFATAEGYRRCLYSVIGPWSTFTYRKFRWSEFRFETRFTTPHIQYGAVLGVENFKVKDGQLPLAGDICDVAPALIRARDFASSMKEADNQWVCWVDLLQEVSELQKRLLEFFPLVKQSLRSWPAVLESQRSMVDDDLDNGANTQTVENPPRPVSRSTLEAKLGTSRAASLPWHKYSRWLRIKNRLRLIDLEKRKQFAQQRTQGVHSGMHTLATDLIIPSFDMRAQSWDFVPNDVLKPPAMIGIADLAVLVIHMGMRWIHFKPADSILQAEGNGLLLNSSYIRALGCLIDVRRFADSGIGLKFPMRRFFIPSSAANAMAFGLLPTCPGKGFDSPFIDVSTFSKIINLMTVWDKSGDSVNRLYVLQKKSKFLFGFLDIIPLVAPMMRQQGSKITRVPSPFDNAVGHLNSGTCRVVFPIELERLIGKITTDSRFLVSHMRTETIRHVLSFWHAAPLGDQAWHDLWTTPDHDARARNELEIDFLEEMHRRWQFTEDYFSGRVAGSSGKHFAEKSFSALLQLHVKHAILADQAAEAEELMRKEKRKGPRYGEDVIRKCLTWRSRNAENIHQYFQRLEPMWVEAQRQDILGPGADYIDFVEVWVVLMLRGFCWNHCHKMIDGFNIPSEYWNSHLPIYIG